MNLGDQIRLSAIRVKADNPGKVVCIYIGQTEFAHLANSQILHFESNGELKFGGDIMFVVAQPTHLNVAPYQGLVA